MLGDFAAGTRRVAALRRGIELAMTTAFFLIVLGMLARLAPHPPNAVAMGAIALYAGAKLPRRWAFVVPLAAMLASDVWLDWGMGQPVFTLTRVAIYGTFALMVAAGRFLRLPSRPASRFGLGLGMSVGASSVFFLTTNLAVWLSPQVASPGHPTHPATMAGLLACYVDAVPFFGNMLAADLIGMATLFGLDWAAHRVLGRAGKPKVVIPFVEV